MKKNKTKKLRIQQRNKCYSINDSCFYDLKSTEKFATLLGTSVLNLKEVAADPDYNIFKQDGRTIEEPSAKVDKIQTRIASLLSRIKVTDALHSGRKGYSHITNAKAHLGNVPLLTTDIRKFFQSTSSDKIYRFFLRNLKCSHQVSKLASELCSCNGHIPTGSRVSMILAYWSNHEMFDEIQKLSESRGIKFTIFVDDLTFSGENVNKSFRNMVKKIIQRHGHVAHPEKTKLYPKDAVKSVTGTAIQGEDLIISNKHHLSIHEDIIQWELSDKNIPHPKLENRILGKLTAQSLVDERYKGKARSFRKFLKDRPSPNGNSSVK